MINTYVYIIASILTLQSLYGVTKPVIGICVDIIIRTLTVQMVYGLKSYNIVMKVYWASRNYTATRITITLVNYLKILKQRTLAS